MSNRYSGRKNNEKHRDVSNNQNYSFGGPGLDLYSGKNKIEIVPKLMDCSSQAEADKILHPLINVAQINTETSHSPFKHGSLHYTSIPASNET